ncbi:hypothetical protein CGRA01v4_06739 [Colletotrichum graminicola]|nr:hypothetical protein CGRA01v4_06739 [Colletotrichum graminicola]
MMALDVAAHGHSLILRTTNMFDFRDGGHSVVGPTHLSLVPLLGNAAGGIMLESLLRISCAYERKRESRLGGSAQRGTTQS